MNETPFEHLPAKARQSFSALPDQRLFFQDAPATHMLFLKTGRLRLIRTTSDGQRVTIASASAGQTLAEASMFAQTYHCDCIADTTSTGWLLSNAALRELIQTSSEFAEAMMSRLAHQVRDERLRVEIMSIKSAQDRVHTALVERGQSGSLASFAAEIGLTPEACSRALRALISQGKVGRTARGRYACNSASQ